MEEQSEEVTPETTGNKKDAKLTGGVPAPTETITFCLEMTQKIVSEHGTASPVSKEDISKILNKAQPTMVMKISTCVQYGILDKEHGKGYQASALYSSFSSPTSNEGEKKAKLLMFERPPLYKKIIENLNNQVLPAEDRFVNLLKSEVYKLNPNTAERAAKVFFENCRALNLIDTGGRFRFSLTSGTAEKPKEQNTGSSAIQKDPPPPVDDLFELPIPLGNKRKAYIRYPLNDLSRKDIKIIVKALAFIASSIEGDDDDFEIVIQENKKE